MRPPNAERCRFRPAVQRSYWRWQTPGHSVRRSCPPSPAPGLGHEHLRGELGAGGVGDVVGQAGGPSQSDVATLPTDSIGAVSSAGVDEGDHVLQAQLVTAFPNWGRRSPCGEVGQLQAGWSAPGWASRPRRCRTCWNCTWPQKSAGGLSVSLSISNRWGRGDIVIVWRSRPCGRVAPARIGIVERFYRGMPSRGGHPCCSPRRSPAQRCAHPARCGVGAEWTRCSFRLRI